MYLVAILDVASRKVLSFRLSNTLTADFCVEALEEAMSKFGVPEIFNTDQGSQFTCEEWTERLKAAGVAISMDGKGRWIGRVGDWRGTYARRGVAVAGHHRCLSPPHVFRFQSPLVEPDVQISRIRLSCMKLRPSHSSRLRGSWEAGRGRAPHRGTRLDIADIRCLAYLVPEQPSLQTRVSVSLDELICSDDSTLIEVTRPAAQQRVQCSDSLLRRVPVPRGVVASWICSMIRVSDLRDGSVPMKVRPFLP